MFFLVRSSKDENLAIGIFIFSSLDDNMSRGPKSIKAEDFAIFHS
jgi:hypothetical protein